MCGLAGVYHYAEPERPVDEPELVRMTRVLAHRGPDDEGYFVDGPLGLGHRRLSIVDLSPTGRQPMATQDGRAWLAYNGEFYDHARHRPRLEARGVSFRGRSDTETLLELLRTEGPAALAKIAGIFAFAYWDADARRLTLARDHMGVKQLYYHDDGRRIVFASEIKALLECANVPREVDPGAVNEYLHFHTPLFERTFFRNVRQLRAAEFLTVDRGGVRARHYWHVPAAEERDRDPDATVEQLREELERVIADQLLSDVPVGAFFSGGIDSSAITAYAKRAGQAPLCFGVHFTGQGVIDERPYQEAAARALGVRTELITLDGSAFPEEISKLMYFQDQPLIGAAMLPMYHVSRLAARRVKVCLGGQAADELFGGYARYGLAAPLDVARSWFGRGRRAGQASGAAPAVGGNLRKQLFERATLWRLAHNASGIADWKARYFNNFAKIPERNWRGLFGAREFVSRAGARRTFDAVLERAPYRHPADQVMYWDAQTYLTGLFQQDDRMSMANSLESRVPFADPRLVTLAARMEFGLKFRDGATKWALRQAVAEAIPAEVLTRRKVGFDTPAEAWMKGRHRDFVRDTLLSRAARTRGFWDARGLERLLDRPSQPLWFDTVWKALCIETWARIFLDRAVPAGIAPVVPVVAHAPPEAQPFARAAGGERH